VYAPNGTDPLPNVTVYIPNDTVVPFPAGVSCPVVGAPPSGVSRTATPAAVGTTTAVDGSFTISNVPVGNGIPIVAVSGRWRVQGTVDTSSGSCITNYKINMPQNQNQGDIPKIAIATGAVDQVECVLLKMGIKQSEFTDPSGSGRINFYTGSGYTPNANGIITSYGAGAAISALTPTQASLMEGDTLADSLLSQYDVLMLPCQGTPNGDVVAGALGTQELANFIAFANAGGRVYASHYSYTWMFNNPPFNGVVNWDVGQTVPTSLTTPSTIILPATVDTGFTAGQTLATWLQDVDASTTFGQIGVQTVKHDMNGVIAPTQSWLTLNDAMGSDPNPVMQFVFDTPIPSASNPTPNQCGRVLYNEYHVENPTNSAGSVPAGTIFPSECDLNAAMTPQEKLLEYMLFELTSEGGQPSLAPLTQDFGPEAVGYPSAPQTFTWTNNSSFAAQVTSATIGGTNYADFSITSPPCGSVAGGASCTITVVFTPSLLGAESATLNVLSAGNTLTAALTGTGVPGYSVSTTAMSFGNVVVGDASSQTLTLVSNASEPQAVPSSTLSANYSISTAACGATVAADGNCVATVTFSPTVLGVETGTLTINSPGSPLTVSLTGTGIPGFTLTPGPLSFGNQDVGSTSSPPLTLTLTSVAHRALATPVFTTTGNLYSVSTAACGATMIAQTSCLVSVTFTPQTTGPLAGTLTDNSANPVYSGLSATMTGNGVDFSISLNPTGGSVAAGDGTTTTATLTPIAGYSSPVTLSCAVPAGAAAMVCSLSSATLTLTSAAAATTVVSIGTTSQYTVIGYSGTGGRGLLWLLAAASGGLLWRRRRLTPVLLGGLLLVLLGGLTSCSSKLPDQNAAWTAPGNYAVTVTATDGQLVHSATYSLTVTAK
jgi:hypothetical protein